MEDELKELKIHSCDELPQFATLTLDNDCLERVVKSFGPAFWRGSGQYGFALELSRGKGDNLIVKVSAVNEQELRIGCELNNLADDETPVFPHAYGWLICNAIPYRWRVALSENLQNHEFLLFPPERLMFTFIQPVDKGWNEAPLLLDHGYRVALFFLLHGLYVAGERLGFRHGDIHSDNVRIQLIQSARREIPTTRLRFGGQYEADVTSELIPRLIDYGRSQTTRHADNRGANDLRQLRVMFDTTLDKRGVVSPELEAERTAFYQFVANVKWDELAYRYDGSEGTNVILPLLNHDYFDVPEIRRHQVKRQTTEPIERCFSCCAPNPGRQINHKVAAPKYFCGDWCYQKIHGICPFIK